MTNFAKLEKMPYAQACVRITDNSIELISYTTVVCSITDDVLVVHGLYSMTTRKHIGAFMQEYLNKTYQFAKQLCEERKAYNVKTGEIFILH